MHLLTRLAALSVAAGLATAGLATPASADPSIPGSFTGYGFDTCVAPDQATMDNWRFSSPFDAVGVYIGGANRLCDDQPNLTPTWVRYQIDRGWRLLPIWVGLQASCSPLANRMSPERPLAEAQGRLDASAAVSTVQALGVGAGSTLWFDMEDYDITDMTCRQAAQSFLSGWTQQLHDQGYRSGVYSNAAAAITALDNASLESPGSYVMPDDIWFAWENGRADVDTGTYVRSSEWDQGERIHQYLLDEVQTYGGVTQNIDLNWLQIGGGSTAPKATKACRGVELDQRRYPQLRRGSKGDAVAVVQCLLRRQRIAKLPTNGRYDERTARAVEKAQRKLDLKQTGRVTAKTWTALHARGSQPFLKVGDVGEPVRRLERALIAASGRKGRVDGVFDVKDRAAVLKLQSRKRLEPTGNVDAATWEKLVAGG
jgi:peptidoglycan hydrolase-like protein with peptidoglycan-binding domain